VKRDLGALTAREHDVVVVGGGIHGVTTAYDAAQRGLSVALVEASDFGSGVSWNSLKTIHGGLRHLQRADIAQARESMRERRALLRIAPDIVRPLPFLVATHGHGFRGPEAFAAALRVYDLLSLDRNEDVPPERRIPESRLLSREEVRRIVPGLDGSRLTGGAVWFDAQVTHGERLVMAFCHAAADAGAVLANYVAATGFVRSGRSVAGIRARDVEGGGELEIRGRMVVVATGPGVDRLLARAEAKPVGGPMVLGMNVVLRRALVTTHALGARSSGRFLFLVPWRDRSIVGTAYDPPTVTPDVSVSRFVEEARRAFPGQASEHGDVSLVHRGLVPARPGGRALETRSRVVDHEAEDGIAGLVSMRAAKLTTARAEAEKAVNLVFAGWAARCPCRCRTASRVPRGAPARRRPGDQAGARRARRWPCTSPTSILRRTDLGTAGPPREPDVEAVAAAMASALGWDEVKTRAEPEAVATV
jgi:glycerol-3-phosphate dehydrogenase